MLRSTFFSNEGMQGAYFLGAIELDISKSETKLIWKVRAASYASFVCSCFLEKLTLVSPHPNTP
jgi:hypothetical protein